MQALKRRTFFLREFLGEMIACSSLMEASVWEVLVIWNWLVQKETAQNGSEAVLSTSYFLSFFVLCIRTCVVLSLTYILVALVLVKFYTEVVLSVLLILLCLGDNSWGEISFGLCVFPLFLHLFFSQAIKLSKTGPCKNKGIKKKLDKARRCILAVITTTRNTRR